MSRRQRKFLLVSAAVHSLLLLLLIVGPAFMPKRQTPLVDLPVLRVIPSELILAAAYGGGTPVETPPELEPEPTIRPPESEPERVQRVEQVPKPKPPTEVKTPEPAPVIETPPKPKPTPKPPPKPPPKTEIKVKPTLVTRRTDDAQAARDRALEEERRRQEKALKSNVATTLSDIKEGLSSSTKIEIAGTGGPAFANYSQAVKSIYDRNWIAPKTLRNDRAAVQVEVVVNHDGRILDGRILKRSGIRSLDDSVQAALDRVRVKGLPRFPPELKARGELQKTFRINFDLRSKLQLG